MSSATEITTEEAVEYLADTLGASVAQGLLDTLNEKRLNPLRHEAAIRVMAKRLMRGCDLLHLIDYTQHFPEPILKPSNGVQNLKAAVEVYEAPLSAFAPVIPELAHSLDFPDALDCITADAVVTVKQPYMRPFTGNVISVNHEAQQVLVEAWFSAAPPAWYDADVVVLVWTAEAADIALERSAASR